MRTPAPPDAFRTPPMLYCPRAMIGPSAEEVPVPEPSASARATSPPGSPCCSARCICGEGLGVLYAAPCAGALHARPARPTGGDPSERLVTRDLDVREARRSAPKLGADELYAVLAGADDSAAEALRRYDEAAFAAVDSRAAPFTTPFSGREAESRRPMREQADEAVVAACSPQPTRLRPRPRRRSSPAFAAPLPRNWFTRHPRLEKRRAQQSAGDLPDRGRMQADIATPGPPAAPARWLGLTATGWRWSPSPSCCCCAARAWRHSTQLGAASLPPTWGFADG